MGAAAPRPAAAQGFGWFGNLFGGGSSAPVQQVRPAFPGNDGAGLNGNARHGQARAHRAGRAPQQPTRDATLAKVPKVPPKNASAFVYVFGDSLGQFLANGLDEALSDRQDVAVVHKARGPTGLVTKDYYDWPNAIDTLLAGKDKIDVAVMMVGSNDRQPMRQDGKSYDVGSDGWNAIYAQRVTAIDEAFRKKGVPLIWVGVPITKNNDFADDMAALNDIYRDAAAKTGATYVDTWEAFSDDNGDFAASGPDINGQTVRLRSADGVLFTAAGARKLAHFVEAHVRRDLNGKAPTPILPTSTAPNAEVSAKKNGDKTAAKPEAGPINNLNEAPVASDGQLETEGVRMTAAGEAPGEDALTKGRPATAPVGRADDLRWPASPTRSP